MPNKLSGLQTTKTLSPNLQTASSPLRFGVLGTLIHLYKDNYRNAAYD